MRSLSAGARSMTGVVFLLLLSACSGGRDGTAPSTSTTSSTSTAAISPTDQVPATVAPPATTASSSAGAVWPRCANADGFSIAYPTGWVTVPTGGSAAGCAWFGPVPFTVLPNSDARPTPVAAKVERVPFATVSAPASGQVSRVATTVAGRPAYRIEERATGEGMLPAGTAVVRYAVDVEGALPGGGTLLLDLQSAAGQNNTALTEVLDRMARSILLVDG